MRNSIHRLTVPYLISLQHSLDAMFPVIAPARCWALVTDFQTGRVRCYGQPGAQTGAHDFQLTQEQIDCLASVQTPLCDDDALRALADDFNLAASDLAQLKDLLTRIDTAIDRQVAFSAQVPSVTPLLMVNCPGINATHLPQFKPAFFCPGASLNVPEAVGLLPALLQGHFRFGVWRAGPQPSTLEALTLQQFIHDQPGAPAPWVDSVREDRRSDILADTMLAELLADHPRRYYLPLYESSFLTGVLVVCTADTVVAVEQRSVWIHALLGAAIDLSHRVSLGRQRLAAHAVRHGYYVVDGSAQLAEFRRAIRWLAPLDQLRVSALSPSSRAVRMKFQRWFLARSDARQVDITLQLGPKAAVGSPTSPASISDALLMEQITQVVQYNELFQAEREQLRYDLSHTVTPRLSAVLNTVESGEFDRKSLARALRSIVSVFRATLSQVRGDKYSLPKTPIAFDSLQKDLNTLFSDLSLDPQSSVFSRLQKQFFPRHVDGNSLSLAEVLISMRKLIDENRVFHVAAHGIAAGPQAQCSHEMLSALCQEAFVNAVEHHDWSSSQPVEVALNREECVVRIINRVADGEFGKAKQIAEDFNRGEVTPGLGLTLIGRVFKPAVSSLAHFDVDAESHLVSFVIPLGPVAGRQG